jgi:hypothetical protein
MPTVTTNRTAARPTSSARLSARASLSAIRSPLAPAIEAAIGTPASSLTVERLGAAPTLAARVHVGRLRRPAVARAEAPPAASPRDEPPAEG